ncbi:Basic-leucine zipper domain [Phytophthora cactorum]|nr:Basic-leucine zipper domain [Phytophthora cactorum]
MQNQGNLKGRWRSALVAALVHAYILSERVDGLPFGYNILNQPGAKPDVDAAQRQWKVPGQNQFMYMGNGARPAGAEAVKGTGPSGAQPSPSEGMRGMTFQEGGGYQMMVADGKAAAPAPTVAGTHVGLSDLGSTVCSEHWRFGHGYGAAGSSERHRPVAHGLRGDQTDHAHARLLSIYQKLQEEDDRRQRRLERNRASARVRREKKKGMVETYEGEVSKLESSLNMLKNHEFGTGNAQELATALEYSSGEHLRHAQMSKDAKMELMARILDQHSRNTDAIRRSNAENQALIAVAVDNSEFSRALRAQLGLTPEQCQRLASLAVPTSQETRKLDAIRKCFSALRAHDWLYVPGIETILHQSRNTMTPHQFQKFLSWSVDNRASIDRLQFVPTPSAPQAEKDLTFIFSED